MGIKKRWQCAGEEVLFCPATASLFMSMLMCARWFIKTNGDRIFFSFFSLYCVSIISLRIQLGVGGY